MALQSSFIRRFLIWRTKRIDDRKFIIFLSILVGVVAGFAAVIIKNSVHFIQELLTKSFVTQYQHYLYFIYPAIGILLVLIFTRYILKRKVGHGIPIALYAISKDNGKIKPHNMFSSIITSAITVGFGGSVGLEGPTVATGAAWGSNIGRFFRLNYRQTLLLLACASAASMSAIFKAPITGIVFVLEVMMLDLTLSSLLPLLFASVSAAITSYLFLGMDVLYPITIVHKFTIDNLLYYILLGILTGMVSVYFTRVYKFIQSRFDAIDKSYTKWIVGAVVLGVIIFFFPSLYGEGYEAINGCLHGDNSHLFNNSIFYDLKDNMLFVFIFFLLVIFLKAIATSVTFGAGGVGGFFAPTLFIGANTGLMFAKFMNYFGIKELPFSNFALIGMAGLIAGVLQAPLTAIFLIAETTGGYEMFLPLMIASSISFATTRIFEKYSVYTYQLARRGELFTHDKDKVVLSLLKVTQLIEKDFLTINEDATLGDLVKVIAKSKRNIVPVIDEENKLHGIVFINDIREIMFQRELYDKVFVKELMFMPTPTVSPDESMEDVARKFQSTHNYNLPVIKDGKYVGFVSRANVFSAYRDLLSKFSED
ncbi:MAG: chloride channel protein family [Bacteroidales bacterium]|jgi:CIC family chloride channel protein|nr:chloride channel protein family [Bacteroidales bacterium]